ncbi:hypothetical protein DXT99_20135 [Pontibacter diazotrophicus]|uniref:Uncharacterized protein n=1 Tax=Pontibacter diazotrophicus TaxID=1400979 RepID=A0A3D8L7E2_9BACT|nr:hypothetical protein [Pontibacter diazotrophicus]RDV13330.1 hypothetical protein DXT99_20135 [Pontibacter diazotrophicus]
MKITKNNNVSANPDENSYEKRVLSFLGQNGFIVPESDQEIQAFISICDNSSVKLPEALRSPFDIERRGIVEPKNEFQSEDAKAIEENLAQAARKGKEIPAYIRQRMEEGRKKAEGRD